MPRRIRVSGMERRKLAFLGVPNYYKNLSKSEPHRPNVAMIHPYDHACIDIVSSLRLVDEKRIPLLLVRQVNLF